MAFVLPIILEGAALLLEGEAVGTIAGAAAGTVAGNILTPVITEAAATLFTEEVAGAIGGAVVEGAVGALTGAVGAEEVAVGVGGAAALSESIGGGTAGTGLVETILTTGEVGATGVGPTGVGFAISEGTDAAVVDTLALTTSGIDDLAINGAVAGVEEEVAGSGAGILGLSEGEAAVAAAGTTVIDQGLAALGITKESVGEVTYNAIVGSIVAGAISQVDIEKALNENASFLFNKLIDTIAGDSDVFSDYSKFIVIGPNGQIIEAEDIYKAKDIKYIDCFELGYSTGIMLTEEAFNLFNMEKKGLPRTKAYLLAAIKSSTENREHAYIARQFTDYLRSSEYINDPQKAAGIVQQLKSVYNGNYQSSAWLDQNYNTHIIDETGVERVFQYSEDAYLNLFGQKFSVPQLHGNYVGPGSVGGALPIDDFDTIALLHDIGYDDNGYFSRYADLQLVARLEAWLEKHPVADETNESFYDKVLFTKFYFTYVAPLASEIAGNMNSPELEVFTAAKNYDFFEYLMFQTVGDVTLNYNRFGYKNPVRKYQVLLKEEQRAHFYAGLKTGIDQNTELIFEKYINDQNLDKLDNLTIVA